MENPTPKQPVPKKTGKIFKINNTGNEAMVKNKAKTVKNKAKQVKIKVKPVKPDAKKQVPKNVSKNQLVNLFTGVFFIFALLVLIILLSMVSLPQEQTCFDGIMNQDETGIDCGGVCNPCFYLDDFGPVDENVSDQPIETEKEPDQTTQIFLPMKVARIFSAKSSNPGSPIFFRVDPIINENEIMEGRNIGKMEADGEYIDRYFRDREQAVLILFIDSALEKVEAQEIEIETDAGNFTLYLPELAENGMYYMLYVSENGSTFYSKNNHLDGRLDMHVTQALTAVHAARLSP